MRWTVVVSVAIILASGAPSHAEEIFSDDFEWGSICAWSNDLWYPDFDDDGFGDHAAAGVPSDCPPPPGFVSNNLDCDDMDEFVHPGSIELCDGVDNDCDPDSPDGMGDPLNGEMCDGPDSDLCEEGTYSCEAGSLLCSDDTGDLLDVCDGLDNDCNPLTPDGSEDPLNGGLCDGPDSDLCEEGTFSCEAGSLLCSDSTDDLFDVCDGLDNDCDPVSPDGSEDPLNGVACDGSDGDLCEEGTFSCEAGSLLCSDDTGDLLDVCDGVDNDCDPTSPDGLEDPLNGALCDGSDSDLCEEGTFSCEAGSLSCSDNTDDLIDLCDGLDNDCDPASPDGSEDPFNGVACDGSDGDLCEEGSYSCEAGSLLCSDETGDLLDVCDGFDNDCDPLSPDGSEDPLNGAMCDGSDTDLCEEGTFSCETGSLLCSDTTGSLYDVCDGLDNDCDPASPDGSEDPMSGAPCDGADSDLCEEGTFGCEAGSLLCSDETGDLLDVCDGFDNDCDPTSADGSEDPLNGSMCDGPDSDLCLEGLFNCLSGVLWCSDNTGNDIEICDGLDNDCDGQIDEDWSCSLSLDGCCAPDCTPADDADCCEAQECSMVPDSCCPSFCDPGEDADCGG